MFAAAQSHTTASAIAPLPTDLAAAELVQQVRRVGVNLNQIARMMNELRVPPPADLSDVLSDIRGFMRRVRRAP